MSLNENGGIGLNHNSILTLGAIEGEVGFTWLNIESNLTAWRVAESQCFSGFLTDTTVTEVNAV